MTAEAEPAAPAGPEILEGPGRYVAYAAPDGEIVIARATGLCDKCASCGCGEQGDPVRLPDFRRGQQHLIAWAMKNVNTTGGLFGMLRGLKRG